MEDLIDCSVFKEIGRGMDFSLWGITCVSSRQCIFPLQGARGGKSA